MTRIGIQLHPQHCSIDDLRTAWRGADALGVDSIWTWDHFYPLYGDEAGNHFEGWSLLAAMACETSNAKLGLLVGCNSYRNPELVADMARTIDHLSGGRLYLGLGAGWFERDYDEYGYDFGTPGSRLAAFRDALPRYKSRLASLTPGPIGDLPILIGGGGEKKTLRYTAEFADAWNSFGPPETYAHKNQVLTNWCHEIGRDPAEIERTILINASETDQFDAFIEAGAEHIILGVSSPFDLDGVQALLDRARA